MEMSRELVLTAETPSAPVGRSSKNKMKGLFASHDNAFFDSPVMSRSHADITMVLDPIRKVPYTLYSLYLVQNCMVFVFLFFSRMANSLWRPDITPPFA